MLQKLDKTLKMLSEQLCCACPEWLTIKMSKIKIKMKLKEKLSHLNMYTSFYFNSAWNIAIPFCVVFLILLGAPKC